MDPMQTLAGSPTHLTRPGGRPQPPSARPDQTATPPTTDRTSLGPAEADVPLPPMLPGLRSNFGNRRPDPERAQQVGEALQDEGGPARGLSRLAGEMVGGAAGRVAGAALCAPVPPAVPICSLVGSAVGANPVAYLIPCHRVIRKTGAIKEYRWGSTRKKAILGWEAAHAI